MEIYRDIEYFGTLENGPEVFVIEITSPDMTIDDRSLETAITDRSLQFGGSGAGVCGWQRGKSGQTSRMTPQCIGEEIVRFAGESRRLSGFELLCAGGSKRQYLHVDVSGIHLGDPPVAEIASCSKSFAAGPPNLKACSLSPRPGPSRNSGPAKCSSRVIVRITLLY